MKPSTIFASSLALVTAAAAAAHADDRHRTSRPATSPPSSGARSVGVHLVPHPDRPMHPKNNPPHQVIIHDPKTNKDEHHVIVVDHRPPHVIDRDPRLRVVVRGYHPGHDWARFHRVHGAWWKAWGITSWDEVGTVTCEAANESTGELYPVSEDRDQTAWDDDTVNTILDQALDDCMGEANGAVCGPVTPSCTFQPY